MFVTADESQTPPDNAHDDEPATAAALSPFVPDRREMTMTLQVVRYPVSEPSPTAAPGVDRGGLITLVAFCTLPLALSALVVLALWLAALVG